MAQNVTLDAGDETPLLLTGDMDAVGVYAFPFGQVAAYTHSAPGKDNGNEDAALVLPVDDHRGVLAVADGVGGMQAGARAARLALENLQAAVETARDEDWSVREAVLDGFDEANRAVSGLAGAATTLAAVRIQDGTVRTFNVGDTSVLITGNHGRLKLQTVPHSPTGYAVHAGVLDEDDALHHADRHLILNAVGGPDMWVDVGSPFRLAPRDTLLIASDGLYDNLQLAEIITLIRKGPLDRAARELVWACRARMRHPEPDMPSKPDDLTVILLRLRN